MRIKDLLIDLQNYDELNNDEQKRLRESYNITIKQIQEIKNTIGN